MSDPQPDRQPDRRTVVRTAGMIGLGALGAAGLAGCGSAASGTSPGAGAATSTGSGAGAPVASVPVGGGVIVGDVVITQPTKGSFKAYSVVCTHQGCPVSKVQNGHIECHCHGSMFDIATGAPTQGPAKRPLAAKTATVKGAEVVVS